MFLVFAIPTYRRPALLCKALRAIASQIEGNASVGIAVYDDSDGKHNNPVIEEIRRDFPRARLTYQVNAKNLGIDENIKNCLASPDAEYVWLLGEDDLVVEGAVEKVLAHLRRYKPVFLFANYIYCDDQHLRFARHAVLPETPGARVMPFEEFARSWIWSIGFIGGCVIRSADWRRQKIERFRGSYYSHVGGIIDAALDHDVIVVGDVLILNRAEDVNTFTWSSSTFDVYFSFYTVLRASRLSERPMLLAACENAAAHLFAVGSLPWLAAKRADGVFDRRVYAVHYAASPSRSAAWKLAAKVISVFPRQPLQWLRRAHLQHRFAREVL